MPIVIKLQDIDEAIENLRYKNEMTLKSRLVRAVRQYYFDDTSAESLQSINTEELVRTIWETGDDRDLLKTKRKNFSSLKSSVNTDLKKLYADGKNPQGLIIGHNNTFSISDEAKDKALAGIMDVFKEKGIDTQSKISDILSALSDILSTTVPDTEAEKTKEEIERLKNVLGDISGKLGLSLEDIVQHAKGAGEQGAQISGPGKTFLDLPSKGEDLSGYIRGGLSEIDSGLQGLVREIEEASADAVPAGIKASMRKALDDIVRALHDPGTDAAGKAQKIMAALEQMLGDAGDGVGDGLSGNQAQQLKQIFHEMAEGAGGAGDQAATATGDAVNKLAAAVSDILGNGELSAGDRITKILSAVNEVIDETLAQGGTGLGDEEIAGIREIMGNVTANLEVFSKRALKDEETTVPPARVPFGAGVPPPDEIIGGGEAAPGAAGDGGMAQDDGSGEYSSQAMEPVEAGAAIESAQETTRPPFKVEVAGGTEGISGSGKAGTGVEESPEKGLTGAAGSEAASEESLLDAVTEIVHALRDSGKDASGKAQKIMAAVERMLGDAIDGAGDELSGDQASHLKQIFHNISKETGFGEDAGLGGQPAGPSAEKPEEDQAAKESSLTGGKLLSEFSSILGDGGLSAGDKINKIMAAVNDMIGELLTDENTGLSSEEVAGIKEMMGNITDNLEAFVQEALTGFDIVEEITEEGGEDGAGEYEIAESPEQVPFKAEVTEAGEATDTAISAECEPPPGEGDIIDEIGGVEFEAETMEIVEATDEEIATAGSEINGLAGEKISELSEEPVLPPEGVVDEITVTDQGTALADGGMGGETDTALVAAGEGELTEALGGGDFDAETMEIVEATDEEIAKARTGSEVSEENVLPPEGVVLPPEGVVLPPEGVVLSPDGVIEEVEVLVLPEAEEARDTAISGKGEPISGEGEIIGEAVGGEFNAETMELVEATDEEIAKARTGSEVSEENVLPPEEVVLPPEGVVLPPEGVVEEILVTPEDGEITDTAIGTEGEVLLATGDGGLAQGSGEGFAHSGHGVQVTPANKDIDGDLREKTDLLTRLAEAAGALSALGPDLSGSVYTEDEIREKAQFLSEEFNRYLSVRDKFYNAHILIKGGNYLVGGAHLAKSELAEQIATLPDFYIGKFPVTNALFEIFVEQTGYVTTAEKYGYSIVYYPRMQRSRDPITGVERFSLHNQAYSKKVPGACWHRPLGPDSSLHLKRTHPVVHVSLEDARAFAAWTGKRLPTEIEWEAAARTSRSYLYPWGDEWKEGACNIEKSLHGDTTPVDQYVTFANSAGVADLLGNVLEWTCDIIGERDTSDTCIAKGASWIAHSEISLTDRHYIEKNVSSNILGFRCVAI